MKENGRVNSSVAFWEDLSREIPFRIEPSYAVIAPYGRSQFKAQLLRTSSASEELCLATCSVSALVDAANGERYKTPYLSFLLSFFLFCFFVSLFLSFLFLCFFLCLFLSLLSIFSFLPPHIYTYIHIYTSTLSLTFVNIGGEMSISSSSSVRTMESSHVSQSISSNNVPLYLRSTLFHPSVRIDKNIFTAHGDTEVGSEFTLKLNIMVPDLYSNSMGKEERDRPLGSKDFIIENPMISTQLFSVVAEGPFLVKFIDKKGKPQTATRGSSLGTAISLPSQGTTTFTLSFAPRR